MRRKAYPSLLLPVQVADKDKESFLKGDFLTPPILTGAVLKNAFQELVDFWRRLFQSPHQNQAARKLHDMVGQHAPSLPTHIRRTDTDESVKVGSVQMVTPDKAPQVQFQKRLLVAAQPKGKDFCRQSLSDPWRTDK